MTDEELVEVIANIVVAIEKITTLLERMSENDELVSKTLRILAARQENS
jgi:hypothetical protein